MHGNVSKWHCKRAQQPLLRSITWTLLSVFLWSLWRMAWDAARMHQPSSSQRSKSPSFRSSLSLGWLIAVPATKCIRCTSIFHKIQSFISNIIIIITSHSWLDVAIAIHSFSSLYRHRFVGAQLPITIRERNTRCSHVMRKRPNCRCIELIRDEQPQRLCVCARTNRISQRKGKTSWLPSIHSRAEKCNHYYLVAATTCNYMRAVVARNAKNVSSNRIVIVWTSLDSPKCLFLSGIYRWRLDRADRAVCALRSNGWNGCQAASMGCLPVLHCNCRKLYIVHAKWRHTKIISAQNGAHRTAQNARRR